MAKKIRKQTYSLISYLDQIREEDIRSDQDVQRLSGQWDASMINELVVTVLTDDYIPPIILGEEEREDETTQLWIIDGLQRSSSLLMFRYGNHKITSAIEDSVIEYQKKKIDIDGKVARDDGDNIVYDTLEFDLKGKTYDELPDELKKKFNGYQIETVVHQNCTMAMISKLVRRYNNHKSMNAAQKAFTYLDKFARKIRGVVDLRFFKDCGSYTGKEKTSGVYERMVSESVMAMFHLDNWQKNGKKMGTYLNENATDEEFDLLKDIICRLEAVVDDKYKDIFNSKNSFIWFTFFHRFTRFGVEDIKFGEFLKAFQNDLHSIIFAEYDNRSFDTIDDGKGTKDKKVIIQKLDMLDRLMNEFLHINTENREGSVEEDIEPMTDEQFIIENVGGDANELLKDMDLYNESLDDLLENTIRVGSKLLDPDNRQSLLALVVYSYKEDKDLDEWLTEYASNNNTYFKDQKRNYLHMLESFEKYGQ